MPIPYGPFEGDDVASVISKNVEHVSILYSSCQQFIDECNELVKHVPLSFPPELFNGQTVEWVIKNQSELIDVMQKNKEFTKLLPLHSARLNYLVGEDV